MKRMVDTRMHRQPGLFLAGLLFCCFVGRVVQAQTITVTGDVSQPYNGTDNPWNVPAGSLLVGNSATGSITVSGAAVVDASSSSTILGAQSTGDGTLTVTGSGAEFHSGGLLEVGESGTATLNVLNGGLVTNPNATHIGNGSGSTGTATVSGPGSRWNSGSHIIINTQGNGTLNIENGGVVNSDSYGAIGWSGTGGVSGTVTVTGAGSQWNNTTDTTVGYNAYGIGGHGTLNILNGGSVSDTDSFIGRQVNSTGMATVDGVGSTWTTSNRLRVGNSGTGTLDVTNGGSVDVTDSIFLGSNSTGDGTVTVSGTASQLSTGKQLAVGHQGTGSLTVSAGGKAVVATDLVAGSSNSSAQGTITVQGTGSMITVGDNAEIGLNGSGTLNVESGSVVSNHRGVLGNNTGSDGTATVTGSGSQWNSAEALIVGAAGTGTLSVEAGGVASSHSGYVGYNPGGTGMATVTGSGSEWNNANFLYAGRYGDATLNIEAGGVVSNEGDGILGANSGSSGTVTVTGSGSQWNQSMGLYVGGNTTTSGGTGDLTIEDSGHVNVTGTTKIWGTGTVTLDGGSLTTGSFDNTVGGTFNHNNGTLTVDGGTFQHGSGIFAVDGADAASHATLTMQNGATWTPSDAVRVGFQESGTMNIQSGAVVSTTTGIVGSSTGSEGTVTVAGTGSQWNNTGNIVLGLQGTGTLNVSDAGVVSTQLVMAGQHTGSTGMVMVTGAGSQLNSDLHMTVGFDGTGDLTVQSGGSATSGTYTVIGDGAANGTATVTDSGSTLQVGTDLFVAGDGTGALNVLNGGQVSVADRISAGFYASSDATVTVSGTGSQLSNNGSFYVGGNPFFAAGTAAVDVLSGGAVNVGDTLKIYNGGSLTRDATSSLTADDVVTNGSLNWGGTLNVSSALASSAVGEIHATGGGSLNGDTLHIYSDGSVTLDASSSLTATHIIADGSLDWTGSTLNVGTGQTLTGSGDLTGVGMVAVANGGLIAPGNSTGTMTAGDVTWGPGGMFEFEVNDFNGTAGSSTLGWDLLAADSIDITATALNPFEIDLLSLTSAQTAGMADNFDFMSDYSLMFASATAGITGFSTGLFSINTSGFQNSFAGNWFVSQTGNILFLNYAFNPAAIPEPSSLALLGLGSLSVVIARRRIRRQT